jgi:hypothetical protein
MSEAVAVIFRPPFFVSLLSGWRIHSNEAAKNEGRKMK